MKLQVPSVLVNWQAAHTEDNAPQDRPAERTEQRFWRDGQGLGKRRFERYVLLSVASGSVPLQAD
jgi:hypothetical protein